MYEGWIRYGGTQIVDHDATLGWARRLLPSAGIRNTPECEPLQLDRYTSPAFDDAPWVEHEHPESGGFLGLYVESVVGFDQPYGTVQVSQVASEGGRIARHRLTARRITVSGFLLGVNEAAVDYGFDWLTHVLVDSAEERYDDRVDIEFLRQCPRTVGVSCIPFQESCAELDDMRRRLSRVTLTDGPTAGARIVIDHEPVGLEVSFTVTAELPGIYYADGQVIETSLPFAQLPMYPTEYFCCEDELDLGTCVTITAPPMSPIQGCFCEPWRVRKACVTLDNTEGLHSADVGFSIWAGPTGLSNLRVTQYQLDLHDEPCPCAPPVPDHLQCEHVLAMIEIAEIPGNSTLTVDPTRRRVTLQRQDEGGRIRDGGRYLAGNYRAPFRLPRMHSRSRSCIVFAFDHFNTDPASEVRNLTVTPFELASGG